MRASPGEELVRRTFEALVEGDLAVLETSLAADAKWRTVEGGYQLRGSRDDHRDHAPEPSRTPARQGRGDEPDRIAGDRRLQAGPGRPREAGIAYMVVTVETGGIVELRGCADRAAAVGYAGTNET